MAGVQLRICELDACVWELDAGTEITLSPAFLGCIQERL